MMTPSDAVIAVTWRCNCRCVMCDIWRDKAGSGGRELAPDAYRNLSPAIRNINISGGEPFLREDLESVVAVMREACPRARIVISTNGMASERIAAAMKRMAERSGDRRRLGLAVSLDGIGETHDRMRGVAGAYERARRTIELLAAGGFEARRLRLAFTATAENAGDLSKVCELARELGAEFTCAVAHRSGHYFGAEVKAGAPPEVLAREAEAVIRRELGSWSPKRWARAYFLRGLLEFNAGRGRLIPCRAARESFFMDPEGDVYVCNALDAVMGNIEEKPLAELWGSAEARAARKAVAACGDGCWMICSVRAAMRRHWASVGWWCLRRLWSGD